MDKYQNRLGIVRLGFYLALACLSLYGLMCAIIFSQVRDITHKAVTLYYLPKVESLIALAGASNQPFQDRNAAIWALGQIGDRRALPVLAGLHTQEKQNVPWKTGERIVQAIVARAIRQIDSDFSVTRWMYRWL